MRGADFVVAPGHDFSLANCPTRIDPLCKSKHDYKKLFKHHVERLDDQQRRQYAANRQSILLIFQAMDAAGKDGAIRHVLSGVNPQGCQVFSYQHPSATELQHDFLWRTTCDLPERGRIGIFNRSYYEEVLIVRVHPELLQAEALAEPMIDAGVFWQQRYLSINNHERHLRANGTRVVKIFLPDCLRGLHCGDQHRRGAVVCGARRSQENRAFDRVADLARYVRQSGLALPDGQLRAEGGTGGDPRDTGHLTRAFINLGVEGF